ncbi:hypothetical protein HNP81_003841 [Peribacillus huizhouensis]|uniref:Uncharacterized protein n=1 Tax=Peribacillus huizhouensis TaxID=1501239 RepID=A0ABR6CUW7_9BACI|nr:hypothetical protein [Peribacillus huizhouensis]
MVRGIKELKSELGEKERAAIAGVNSRSRV